MLISRCTTIITTLRFWLITEGISSELVKECLTHTLTSGCLSKQTKQEVSVRLQSCILILYTESSRPTRTSHRKSPFLKMVLSNLYGASPSFAHRFTLPLG